MAKRGNNIVSFVNESLYTQFSKSTWWIDSGATVHVANSLQGFHSMRTTLRSERRIEVANGVEAEVKVVGDISLELAGGFNLLLRDVLFVPSCHRNLISVSCLDKDNYECHFGHGKCAIGIIMLMWVMLYYMMSFICYHFVKKFIPFAM